VLPKRNWPEATLARLRRPRHASVVTDAWDEELVMSHLTLLADVAANTARIVQLLEEDDGEETEED
jgi:hypothetical protein